MYSVGLLVMTDGRGDYLKKTLASMNENLQVNFDWKLMIDDSGEAGYREYLQNTYKSEFDTIFLKEERRGLADSVAMGWDYAFASGVDFLFHLEEDFIFNTRVNVHDMAEYLTNITYLAQMALKRDSVNPAEVEVGGFMGQRPNDYVDQHGWVEQNHLFTLNPCLIPHRTLMVEWPKSGGEREFTDKILATRTDIKFGYLGQVVDAPLVTHIGSARSEGWKL